MDQRAFQEPVSPDAYGPVSKAATGHSSTLVKLVAASVLTRSGESFFDSLLRLLAAEFDVKIGLVGIADTKWEAVETLVAFAEGQRAANFSYTLRGTPCETVVSPSQVCVYPAGVADMFPSDSVLDDLGAVGYVGMPLFNRDGETMGLMALVTDARIEDADAVAAMLKVFGRRASLELEHLLALRHAAEGAARLEHNAMAEELTLAEFVEQLEKPS